MERNKGLRKKNESVGESTQQVTPVKIMLKKI